jgi:hypothetical protein
MGCDGAEQAAAADMAEVMIWMLMLMMLEGS